MPEVLAHPRIAARAPLHSLPASEGLRPLTVLNAGFGLDDAPLVVDRPPPTLGQDTAGFELGIGPYPRLV